MKVKFLGPVQHDADLYQEGDTADLPDAAAKALIEAKAAVDLNAEKAAAKAAKAEAERLAAEQAEAERLAAEKAEANRLAGSGNA